jgi:hypothetical protein
VFKEFGIRLTFTPTVIGDRVHLKVRPEVSTLDFANAVTLGGFRIPALTTRRTETELELQNGQTFAIAGLMNNSVTSTLSKVPGIGDIPILGNLFKSKAAQKQQTELIVMITPQILPNNSSGVSRDLPRMQEPYLPALPQQKSLPEPPPAFSGPRSGTDARPATAPVAAGQPAGPSATSAAAAVSALTPSGPRMAEPVAPAAGAPAGSTASTVKRSPSTGDRKTIERARRQEQEKTGERTKAEAQASARAKVAEGRRLAEQRVVDQKKAEIERERQETLAREQARRGAEQAKRDQVAARKQAVRDREQQKTIEEAAARLKAAEALYNAEVAKKNNQ